jgi:transposase
MATDNAEPHYCCGRCKETKPASAYRRRSAPRTGLQNYCKQCQAEYQRSRDRRTGKQPGRPSLWHSPRAAAMIYDVSDNTIRKWVAYSLVRSRTQPGKGKQHKRQRTIHIRDLRAAMLLRKPVDHTTRNAIIRNRVRDGMSIRATARQINLCTNQVARILRKLNGNPSQLATR